MKKFIKYLWLILKHFKHYRYWRNKRKGVKYHDLRRGSGYYITTSKGDQRGRKRKITMKSGKTALFELLDYAVLPGLSLISHSTWNMIGYDGMKAIHECTFREFLKIYTDNEVKWTKFVHGMPMTDRKIKTKNNITGEVKEFSGSGELTEEDKGEEISWSYR